MNGDLSQGGDGTISDGLIEQNTIYENGVGGCAGINMDGVTNTLIRNNLLYQNHATGIAIFQQDGAVCSHDNIEVGMQFERGAEDGESEDGLFTITDIADDKVVVDGNHPLAGVSLVFACTVANVRAATEEEITHGHVHGEHGHHH